MRTAKEKYPTYRTTDTHWIDWGVYNAHLAILDSVNNLLKTQIDPKKAKIQLVDNANKNEFSDMFNGLDEWIHYQDPEKNYLRVDLEGACCLTPIISDGTYLVFENPQAQKTAWIVGDSFSIALQKYMPTYFRKTVFMHFVDSKKNIPRALKDSGKPDIIIDERAERYVDQLPDPSFISTGKGY